MTAGVGLRAEHQRVFLEERPRCGFLEVHSENYMSDGGPRRRALFDLRRDYAISLHGVGLSLGSAEGLSADHLRRLKTLVDDYQPFLVSEHLAWSRFEGLYLNDLLPLPYSEESLELVCRNVERAQEALGRPILMENPSSYLTFASSVIPEAEFLAEVVRRTGCRLLLDVNNLYVSTANCDLDTSAYLAALPGAAVGEIHLAGHSRQPFGGHSLLIDDHASRVSAPVWALYTRVLGQLGPRPTLIEWDSDLPALPVLLEEAAKAQGLLDAERLAGAA